MQTLLNQIDQVKIDVEGCIKFPFDNTKKTALADRDIQRIPSLSESDEETTIDEDEESENEEEEDEYVVTDRKQESQNSSRLTKNTEISSDESEDEDHMNDNYQLLNEFQNKNLLDNHLTDSNNSDCQFYTPSHINKNLLTFKIHSTSLSSISRKPTIISTSTPLSHKKTFSPQQPLVSPITKEHDSYFEEDDELKRLRDSSEQEEVEETLIDAYVQKLRTEKYVPGTQFRVIHNFKGLQLGDLRIHKDEILTLIEQKSDDWWLFKNSQTQQQGLVPINHIQLQSQTADSTSSLLTFVNVFKTNNYIPSDLAPLTEDNRYKLFRTLIPKMSESNFVFNDLHCRYDKDQIYLQQVKYQKILTIKKCSKIPKIKDEQIHILNRCIRVCLSDGFEIISNIHSIRAQINDHKLTENWYFSKSNNNTFIDEQSQFLIRSNDKHFYLLIELSQLCQSKINQEKYEISCGWIIISLHENNKTKNYNKILQDGHILLNPQYKYFYSNGLTDKIKARIQFRIESCVRYDNLPLSSMIIPINLIQILDFYRNELAYQFEKHSSSNSLSTKPINSIFLSTFYQTLEQPDLIYVLQRLSPSINREDFLKIYELSIYPLLFYRLLPSYNFHDKSIINQRRKLINELISKKLRTKQLDILSILLDPNLTNKWTRFTTDEICFSLQKYLLIK